MNWESFLERVKESEMVVFYIHCVYPMDSKEFLSLSPMYRSELDSDTGEESSVFSNFNNSTSVSVKKAEVESSKVMNDGSSIVCVNEDGTVVYITAYHVGCMVHNFFFTQES